jgi:hypothetical protein
VFSTASPRGLYHEQAVKRLAITALLVLAACNDAAGPRPPPVNVRELPAAHSFNLTSSLWRFEFSLGMPRHPAQVTSTSWAFDFPVGSDSATAPSVHYVMTTVGAKVTGKQIVIEWQTQEDGEPVYQGALGDPKNTCGPPAHFDIIIQRMGDDLKAEFYRWFRHIDNLPSSGVKTVPLDGDWISVFGRKASTTPGQFEAALAEVANIGLTFGWGCFSGHGVNIARGSSQFTLHKLATE